MNGHHYVLYALNYSKDITTTHDSENSRKYGECPEHSIVLEYHLATVEQKDASNSESTLSTMFYIHCNPKAISINCYMVIDIASHTFNPSA